MGGALTNIKLMSFLERAARMRTPLGLLCVLLWISKSSGLPVEKDLEYRLPTTIIPSHYDLELTLEKDAFTKDEFSGVVAITFDVAKDQTVNQIKLHAKLLQIKSAKLKNGAKDIPIEDGPYESDEQTSILTLQANEDLSGNSYVLTIEYSGELSETSMHGFYKSTYEEDGVTKYLATTQFEPTHAREAFPSFDEPGFKATFNIKITFPKNYNALSNTAADGKPVDSGDLQTVKFQTTPKMSTYLIAFIVSEFDCDDGEDVEKGVPTRLCSRSKASKSRDLALGLAPQFLQVMEDYTGYKYGDSEIGKMDEVAIPDFSAGAMENWGLVTYREAALLWDEDESSNQYKQRVATVVSHELSHQWFGDLVTLNWWANVFLNEGFATYFEYHSADEVLPDWELRNQFVVEQLQTALKADASKSSQALSFDVDTPEDISNRFDSISYNKGGSVLRMAHHILTLPKFKKGLQSYIAKHKLSNAEPSDLWKELGAQADLPKDISFTDVMDSWTNQAGYPLLAVKSNGDDIIISQKRFLTSGEEDTKWYVPISYATSKDKSFETTTAKAWLTPDKDLTISKALAGSDWIVLNNQQTGYYRINYESALWKKISAGLAKKNFDGIHSLNRAQIVDDLFSFSEINLKTLSEVFEILSYLKAETDYYPWYAAFAGYSNLIQRTGNKKLRSSLTDYLSDLMGELYKSVPFDEENADDQIYTLKQVLALTWACSTNNEECISNAKKQFAAYRDDDTKPSNNLKSVVYCNGLRHSDDIKKDWKFLWDKYTGTDVSTEQVTILNALGCATDETVLADYLKKAITEDSGVRRQDATYVFSSVYSSNPEGVDVVLDFIVKNYKGITEHFGSTSTLKSLVSSVADRFTSQDQVDSLTKFAKTDKLEDDVKSSAEDGVKSAKTNIEWTKSVEKQLTAFFSSDDDDGDNAAATSQIHLGVVLTTALVFLYRLL